MTITWEEKNFGADRKQITAQVNFGIRDIKGRELGMWLVINPTQDIWQWDDTQKKSIVVSQGISGRSQQTRNEESFGASQSGDFYISLDEAKLRLEDKALAAKHRYEKKAAKNNGIYI